MTCQFFRKVSKRSCERNYSEIGKNLMVNKLKKGETKLYKISNSTGPNSCMIKQGPLDNTLFRSRCPK